MDSKLQELTDKIYTEGVEKGKEEAAKIVEKANAEAKAIVAKAKAEPKSKKVTNCSVLEASGWSSESWGISRNWAPAADNISATIAGPRPKSHAAAVTAPKKRANGVCIANCSIWMVASRAMQTIMTAQLYRAKGVWEKLNIRSLDYPPPTTGRNRFTKKRDNYPSILPLLNRFSWAAESKAKDLKAL